jgi:pimeloyl-ACP methyl ester carboxylesterase
MSMRPLVALLCAASLLAATAACSEEPTAPQTPVSATESASPGPTLEPPGQQCPEEAATGRSLRLTNSAGYSLAAIELGSGPQAVVLAHQSEGSLCEWLPFGRVLAEKGYRVVAFDFAGAGSSTETKQKTYVEDIRTGVAYLRENGVTKIAVMGASMGATMSVVAAAAIAPPVDGVIALSPPVDFDGVNAEKAAPSLNTPALYIAGDKDGDFATYAAAIAAATPAEYRQLLVVEAPQHGIQMLAAETQATINARNAIERFLADHLALPTPTPTPPATN